MQTLELDLTSDEYTSLKNTMVQLAGYQHESVVDGPGVRTVVFFQGCTFYCKGCHNTHTHDKNVGKSVTALDVYKEIYESKLASGVTFSGGEPFLQEDALLALAKVCKAKGRHITIYTGHEVEELLSLCSEENKAKRQQILANSDLVITGRFVEELKTVEKPFVGSLNQELYYLAENNPWK